MAEIIDLSKVKAARLERGRSPGACRPPGACRSTRRLPLPQLTSSELDQICDAVDRARAHTRESLRDR